MRTQLVLTMTLAVLGLASSARAGDDVKKAQKQVEDYVSNLVGNKQGFRRVAPIQDETLKKLLPGVHCFGVLFPQFPIGIEPPAPLKVANIVIVDKDGKMQALSDVRAMEKFCKANFPAAQSEEGAAAAARAWLKLSQHLHSDGFYQFDLGERFPVSVNDQQKPAKVSGLARVKPVGGNKGQIEATLSFGADGKLVAVAEKVKLIEGIRPICQATRLLDPDPVIRKMAERDLLVMGRLGEEYLQMQRARASAELRREIDRVWRQILDEDR